MGVGEKMFRDKIIQIINKRTALHMEDYYAIEKCRNTLIELLSNNEADTINFLETCEKDYVMWISEVFEEVAYNLQSQKYIETLKMVDKKYSELDLGVCVEIAERFMLQP